MAVELRLLVHSHNGCYERTRYKHKFTHCRQVEELTVSEGQLCTSELVSCLRALNGNLVDVPGAWVFPICRCPYCCRIQILAPVMSVYSMGCAFKARGVRHVWANLAQGYLLQCTVWVAWTKDQLRQGRGISKFFAKGNSKGAVHVHFGKIISIS